MSLYIFALTSFLSDFTIPMQFSCEKVHVCWHQIFYSFSFGCCVCMWGGVFKNYNDQKACYQPKRITLGLFVVWVGRGGDIAVTKLTSEESWSISGTRSGRGGRYSRVAVTQLGTRESAGPVLRQNSSEVKKVDSGEWQPGFPPLSLACSVTLGKFSNLCALDFTSRK